MTFQIRNAPRVSIFDKCVTSWYIHTRYTPSNTIFRGCSYLKWLSFWLCVCVFDFWNIFQLSKTSLKQNQMWEQKRKLSVSSLCVHIPNVLLCSKSFSDSLFSKYKTCPSFCLNIGFLQSESILAYIPILTQDVGWPACNRLLDLFLQVQI